MIGVSQLGTRSQRLPWIALGTVLCVTLVANLNDPPFTADSWSYLELAETLGRDFYRVRTWRSFDTSIPYSRAFPPLWPLFIAAIDASTGLGIYGGYLAGFVVFLAFAIVAEKIARRLRADGAGLTSAVFLLAFGPLREELKSARSMPLYLLLFASGALALTTTNTNALRRAFYVGLAAGLMVMTRFDGMFAAVCLVGLVSATSPANRWRSLVAAGVGIVAALSPWIAYSISKFGVVFATDNAQVAMSAQAGVFVLDFFATRPPTLAQAPAAWLLKVFWNVPLLLMGVVRAFALSVVGIPLTAAALIIRRRALRGPNEYLFSANAFTATASMTLPLVGTSCIALFAQLTTGYFDLRYFAPLIWSAEFSALVVLIALSLAGARFFRAFGLSALMIGLVVAVAEIPTKGIASPRFAESNLHPVEFTNILNCLRADGGNTNNTVLFYRLPPYKFAALTGWQSSPTPTNWSHLDDEARRRFLGSFAIVYVVGATRDSLRNLPGEELRHCTVPMARIGAAGKLSVRPYSGSDSLPVAF